MKYPVLYSFRRCPYAMRARLALAYTGVRCELREVVLRDKPQQLLDLSPKGTVPVLQLRDGRILEESFDILKWALSQNDPANWQQDMDRTEELVRDNDGPFKQALDKYKYASRHPEEPRTAYRARGEQFLAKLDHRLRQHDFLLGDKPAAVDIAIFPFIRQFAFVDKDWFDQSPYEALNNWLKYHLESPLFHRVMKKYSQWQPDQPPIFFPD
ncbi:glutathione S-transferase [Emcibacter nanhaiensis]|uniref:Glutathione S-transferase n=1 Tax=Emcibacter nanhaiensis TaxID=1505037 RepID=A0A501PP73_9PROT|nr:glutathione S-transferase [Emcibacter nanhaiensis]TPD61948.1 glutathione S-transferase [Emcibacter nanhaiensis]